MLNIISEFGRLYPEIMDELRKVESYAARWVYLCIVCCFPVDELWETHSQWTIGVITPTHTEIADVAEVSRSNIADCLNALAEQGLIEETEDGSIKIWRYMKKDDANMSAKEISECLAQMRQEIKALKGNRI